MRLRPTRDRMSHFSKKRRAAEQKFPVPSLTYLPGAEICLHRLARLGRIFGLQTHRRLEQSVKGVVIWLAVSLEPQRKPQSIRRPRGRPSDWNPGPRIASRTPTLHRRHSLEKQRSQNGYGEGPEYSPPRQTQCSTVYFNRPLVIGRVGRRITRIAGDPASSR
jgi:hypothetical protein